MTPEQFETIHGCLWCIWIVVCAIFGFVVGTAIAEVVRKDSP
jgi:uncharacterized membrane protein YoaK (UPF0700 family)